MAAAVDWAPLSNTKTGGGSYPTLLLAKTTASFTQRWSAAYRGGSDIPIVARSRWRHERRRHAGFSIDPLHCAAARLLAAVGKNRPRKLHGRQPARARWPRSRVADIEPQLIACTDWLKAIVDDTSHHCHARRRLDDITDGCLRTWRTWPASCAANC